MNSALITGISGFLGHHCSMFYKNLNWCIDGVDGATPQMTLPVDSFFNTVVTLDFLKKLNKRYDLIIHCAGSGSVGYSRDYPYEDYQMNVEPLVAILEYIRLFNPEAKLIFPSSAAVYGSKGKIPLKETEPLNPISPYGFHKLIGEKLCESYSMNFSLRIAIIRFFSLYGPGLKKQLLWDACQKLSSAQGRTVFFSGNGNEIRDWLHITDALSLIHSLYNKGQAFEIVNAASGRTNTVRELLSVLIEKLPFKVPVQFDGKMRDGDPQYYIADISKALSLGWRPAKGLTQGIEDFTCWYLEQLQNGIQD
jgi:UDP-glucose 4-epimerase